MKTDKDVSTIQSICPVRSQPAIPYEISYRLLGAGHQQNFKLLWSKNDLDLFYT